MFRKRTVHYVYGGRPSRLHGVGKKLGWFFTFAFLAIGVTSYMRSAPVASVNAQQLLPVVSLPERPSLSPFESPTPYSTGSLNQRINDWMKAHPNNDWSVAVSDLATSETLSTSDQQYAPASLYKILLLPALFDKHDIKEFDKIKVAGKTLGQCVEIMLTKSDNPCGEAIANDGYAG